MTVEDYLARQSERTNAELDRLLPDADEAPTRLHEAMRYSVFAGGKRLRPALAIAAGELAGADASHVMPVACALELIHTYSLVHDDLPAMDDDDLRRGRPTCHKAYGEATAILAGDALLTLAFRVLGEAGDLTPDRRVRLIVEIARAAGTPNGMVAGQSFDLEAEGAVVTEDGLRRTHAAKTGALLTASVLCGAIAGGASRALESALRAYGNAVGLAFQIADDVLDVTATSAELGKTPGKDSAAAKATFPALYGIEGSRARARALVSEAIAAIEEYGDRAEPLRQMACFVIDRRK